MIMRLLKYVGAAAYAMALGGSAVAATVMPIEGRLQVNTGSGYHAVSATTEVKPGASVMVGAGGKAEIQYTDGCRIPVTPGAVAVVAPVSPCAQGQAYSGYNRCAQDRQDRQGCCAQDQAYPGSNRDDYRDDCWLGYGLLAVAGAAIGCALAECGLRENNVAISVQPASP
jgi:hypothetical protein